jgi:hypothetical protein
MVNNCKNILYKNLDNYNEINAVLDTLVVQNIK